MAQLAASILSNDEEFKRQISRLLRAGGVPVAIVEGRAEGIAPDVFVVDIRADASSGMAAVERLRATHGGVAIFAIAASAEPDLILQAMRAGANEFFPWSPGGETQSSRAMEESFHGAVRRTAARREAAHVGAKQPCVTHVFLGAKGGAGTTTVAVNCAVELAQALEAADGHRRPEAVPRRSGAVSRRAPQVHGARRDREPAPPRQGLPERAGLEAQVGPRHPGRVRAVRSSERPGRRRHRRAPARAGARLRVHRHRRRQPDQRVHGRRAVCRRDGVPHHQPGRPRRSATRSGWSIGCVSSAPAASASRSC